jgi:hypothetical protein
MIDIERVKSQLDYDPQTGIFIWRDGPRQRSKTNIAGAINVRHGYRYICIYRKPILAHRLAWAMTTGEWPENDIDHIDRNRDNNAFANLREATRSQNLGNSGLKTTNTSGFKGVCFFKPKGLWRARITFNYREIHIGYFASPEAANKAYEAKAKELFGEFAIAS